MAHAFFDCRLLLIAAAAALWPLTSATAAGSEVNPWVAIGPDGADIVALAIDPAASSTIYAATKGSGVLRSTNAGLAWSSASQGLPNTEVKALAIDPATPSTLYAGTPAGAFKTTDSGEHWAAINGGLSDATPLDVGALAIDPGSPATVYAGTSGGLFKSVNGGASWTAINAEIAGLVPRVITVDPSSPTTLYVGVDDVTNDADYGVYKSVDAGGSWTRVYRTPPYADGGSPSVVAIAVDPRAPSHLYLALAFDQVLKSLDGGATWKALSPNPRIVSLAVDPGSFATLYAGTYSGLLYRSIDAGDHWTPVTAGLTASSINVVAAAASNTTSLTLYAGAGNGLYRSADGGDNWTRMTLGVRTIRVGPMAVDPSATSTLYVSAAGIVMKTTDGGVQWSDSSAGLLGSVFVLAIDPAVPSTVYAASGSDPGGGTALYRSTDSGSHWTPIPHAAGSGLQSLAIAKSQPSTLFIGMNFTGVLKTTDGGTSWTVSNNGLTAVGPFVSALAVDPTNADTVYAATPPTGQPDTDAKLFKSTDGAAHWRQVPITLPFNTAVTRLIIDPVQPSTIYATYANFGDPALGGVTKSTTGGESWNAPQTIAPNAWVWTLAIDPRDARQVYAATTAGVYKSADGAASWTSLNAGLPSLDVSDVSIDASGTLLRAATSAGLFEYTMADAPTPAIVSVIEYRHAVFDHYFITAIPDEIAKLDSGAFAGWARTGLRFNAYAASGVGTSPVCRFFTTAFAPTSSHFLSAFEFECGRLRADSHWMLESSDVFDTVVPVDDDVGSCATGFSPVYRLYNNGQGGAPNHRYTTDLTVRSQMIAQGWVPEGFGRDAVAMCSPQ